MKFLLLLGAVASLSGCRFWYKPVKVANAIGEEKTVLAGDTLRVHREQRFEVYGPTPEAVYDGYEQMNRAYRAFERYFGSPAPRIAVVLSADSTVPFDVATLRAFRDRGFTVMRYVRPRGFRQPTRYGALAYGGVLWPLAPTAARTMLALFAQSQLQLDGYRSDTTLLEKYPAWFRAAMIHLIGEGGLPLQDLEYLREKRTGLMPLRELLVYQRSPASDSLFDPSRRNDADEASRMIGAESTAFARYLVEKEGPVVLGRFARGYLSGRSLTDMLAELNNLPHELPELDTRFKLWLENRET